MTITIYWYNSIYNNGNHKAALKRAPCPCSCCRRSGASSRLPALARGIRDTCCAARTCISHQHHQHQAIVAVACMPACLAATYHAQMQSSQKRCEQLSSTGSCSVSWQMEHVPPASDTSSAVAYRPYISERVRKLRHAKPSSRNDAAKRPPFDTA